MYQVIASGSSGNAVLYFDKVLVDCGVPFASVKPFLNQIQIILLSHGHGDHLNINTLRAIQAERPGVRIGCGIHMVKYLAGIRNIDVYHTGELYDYVAFQISPYKLYHDIENYGYRIFSDGKKVFHATDTYTLEGLTAKNYDLYAIEHNYDADTINESIAAKQAAGEYAYQKGVINSHLSEQQARDFIFKNAGPESKVLRLHESKI